MSNIKSMSVAAHKNPDTTFQEERKLDLDIFNELEKRDPDNKERYAKILTEDPNYQKRKEVVKELEKEEQKKDGDIKTLKQKLFAATPIASLLQSKPNGETSLSGETKDSKGKIGTPWINYYSGALAGEALKSSNWTRFSGKEDADSFFASFKPLKKYDVLENIVKSLGMRDVRTGYYNTLEKERKNVGQASYLALSEPQIIKGSTEKRPQILVAVQEKGDVNTAWMLADHLYPTASKEEIIKAAGGSSEKKPALTAKLPLSPLLSPLPTSPTKEAIVKKMDVKPAAKKWLAGVWQKFKTGWTNFRKKLFG